MKDEDGIKYKLTSMGTIVEADRVEKLLKIAGKMHKEVLREEVKRVVTTVKIDDRLDKRLTISGKVSAVRRELKDKV